MQLTKVAPPGFERETEIVVARALTSVATEADYLTFLKKKLNQKLVIRRKFWIFFQIETVQAEYKEWLKNLSISRQENQW